MVSDRIKHLRTTLKMSQAEFSKAIFLSNGYIADLEMGNKKANNRILRLISLTFGVNETWLKSGTGDMLLTSPTDKLQRMTSLFNELPPIYQEYVMGQIEQLLTVIERDHKDNPER
jgi:transcriptional regulator with XRE-family HTH domain